MKSEKKIPRQCIWTSQEELAGKGGSMMEANPIRLETNLDISDIHIPAFHFHLRMEVDWIRIETLFPSNF